MTREYFVIINLKTLLYMKNGEETYFAQCAKFLNEEEAKKEISTYDDTENFGIYKVTEHIQISYERV